MFGIRRPGVVTVVLIATGILVVLLAYLFFASGLHNHIQDYIIRPGH